jgi:hypothetical protein
LIKVLRAFTGGDGDGFIIDMFSDLMKKLQSAEEDSLKQMDTELVLDAVSVALTKWSGVLSSPMAAGADEDELRIVLRNALSIDVEEVGQQDNRKFKRKCEARAF